MASNAFMSLELIMKIHNFRWGIKKCFQAECRIFIDILGTLVMTIFLLYYNPIIVFLIVLLYGYDALLNSSAVRL